MSFYICFCGYTSDNHNFRHEYRDTVLITKKEYRYVMNVTQYPEYTLEKCGVEQCAKPKALHGSIINHEYVPTKMTNRKINLAVKNNMTCCVCFKPKHAHTTLTKYLKCNKEWCNKCEKETEYKVLQSVQTREDATKIVNNIQCKVCKDVTVNQWHNYTVELDLVNREKGDIIAITDEDDDDVDYKIYS
jgi:hypothetical protein